MYLYVLSASILIMLASLSGKLATWGLFGTWLTTRTRYLVAFAAGVFTVIIYGLAEELLHEGIDAGVLGGFLLGAVLLEAITRLLPKGTHHHHGAASDHAHTPLDARRMMLGDAVHNVHDGFALVPAFLISPVVGFGTTFGIFLHEVVQEIAEFFVLREAGYSVKRALMWNFIVSSTLLIGVALSLTLASVEALAHPLVAFATGGFTYVLVRDLLPSALSHARTERNFTSYLLMFVVGFALMAAVAHAVPHEEHHEELPLPEGFELV